MSLAYLLLWWLLSTKCSSAQHWRRWLLSANFTIMPLTFMRPLSLSAAAPRTPPADWQQLHFIACNNFAVVDFRFCFFCNAMMLQSMVILQQQRRHSTPPPPTLPTLLLMLHVVVCRLWQMSFTLLYVLHTHVRIFPHCLIVVVAACHCRCRCRCINDTPLPRRVPHKINHRAT